ncbi:MAG TPA: dinitrogenase iron-molybdenum cofactor biosynthesis protein [Spirochaetes bacterium]|nr:dinitrogenase iron-molybdenum cofactor biosynthesis protein [Spirochaetota bacterium]
MKIAITAEKNDLSSPVDTRFGRARGFIIYDVESGETAFVDNNQNLQAAQGAGIQAARNVINTGVGAVITGNVGPKAYSTLSSGNVEMYLVNGGSVEQAIEDYKQGRLSKVSGANVEGHW